MLSSSNIVFSAQVSFITFSIKSCEKFIDSGLWFWFPAEILQRMSVLNDGLHKIYQMQLENAQEKYQNKLAGLMDLTTDLYQTLNELFYAMRLHLPMTASDKLQAGLSELIKNFAEFYSHITSQGLSADLAQRDAIKCDANFTIMFNNLARVQKLACANITSPEQLERYIKAKYLSDHEKILENWRILVVFRYMYFSPDQSSTIKAGLSFLYKFLPFVSATRYQNRCMIPQVGADIDLIREAARKIIPVQDFSIEDDCAELILATEIIFDLNAALQRKLNILIDFNRKVGELRESLGKHFVAAVKCQKIIAMNLAWQDVLLHNFHNKKIPDFERQSWLWQTKKNFLTAKAENLLPIKLLRDLCDFVSQQQADAILGEIILLQLLKRKRQLEQQIVRLEMNFVNGKLAINLSIPFAFIKQTFLFSTGELFGSIACASIPKPFAGIFSIEEQRGWQYFFGSMMLSVPAVLYYAKPWLSGVLSSSTAQSLPAYLLQKIAANVLNMPDQSYKYLFATTVAGLPLANCNWLFVIGKFLGYSEDEMLRALPMIQKQVSVGIFAITLMLGGVELLPAFYIAEIVTLVQSFMTATIARLPISARFSSVLGVFAALLTNKQLMQLISMQMSMWQQQSMQQILPDPIEVQRHTLNGYSDNGFFAQNNLQHYGVCYANQSLFYLNP